MLEMSKMSVVIVVDQYAHNATVYCGDGGVCFALPRMYGEGFTEEVECRFERFSGTKLDMDDVPYKAVGDLRYYCGVVYG